MSSHGLPFIKIVCEALWTVDGHHAVLNSRSCAVPPMLSKFQGYNCPEQHRHVKASLDSLILDSLSKQLLSTSQQLWMQQSDVKDLQRAIEEFGCNLRKYSQYLEQKKVKVSKNRLSVTPVRKPDSAQCLEVLSGLNHCISPAVQQKYHALNLALDKCDPYSPVFVNDFQPEEASPRTWRENLRKAMKEKTMLFTYSSGNNKGDFLFVWKVCSDECEASMTLHNHGAISNVLETMNTYHSRYMRKVFAERCSRICHMSPAVKRCLYRELTSDCSASETVSQSKVDGRVRFLFESEDCDLIPDLRHLNEGRPEVYNSFWAACAQYIEEMSLAAADDRRHDSVVHLATALSAPDMHKAVSAKLPPSVARPSVKWLYLQFWPKDPTRRSAIHHTGRLDIKFMVQSRQFRATHPDAHYAAALFLYLRQYAIRFRDHCSLVYQDDKHHCKVGEPGYPVAAVERGKKVLVAIGKSLQVGDHDFTKCSLIPSVTMFCDIPENMTESFYRGQVYIGLKTLSLKQALPLAMQQN